MIKKRTIILFVTFILLATATYLVQRQIRGKLGTEVPSDILYLPQGQYVKIVALGFDSFMADMLWLRSLQYFGGHFMYDQKYPVVDRLLNVITTLEPTFIDVYSFGAMVLSEEIHERDKAVAFLDKGIENNPKNWNLPYQLGFLWFEELQGSKDSTYRKTCAENAIKAYSIATSRPNCPNFVGRIITQMYYEAGWKELAREMWERELKDAEKKGDKLKMQIFEDKLLKDKFQEIAAPVQMAVFKYYKKYKKAPKTLADLVNQGFIDKIPLDPITGGPLAYNPKSGRVYSIAKPQFSALP